MKTKSISLTLAVAASVVAMLLVAATTARAAVAISFSCDDLNYYGFGNPFTLGENFSVDHAINVTALGYLNSGPRNHDVGIFDTNGNLLVSATVNNRSDPLSAFFHYHTLPTPFFLEAGTYVLAGVNAYEPYTYTTFGISVPGLPDFVGNGSAAPGFNFYDNRYVVGTTLVFPDYHSGTTNPFAWIGPNFQYNNFATPLVLTNFGFTSNQFGFDVTGYSSNTVVIEASTNCVNWTSLMTNTLDVSPLHFSDPTPTILPRRFYRARTK